MSKNFRSQLQSEIGSLFPRLWRFCLMVSGSRQNADDLAQQTCLRAFEKLHLLQDNIYLDRWLFRMAQRIWLNELRSQAVRRGGGLLAIEDVDLPAKTIDPDTNIFIGEVFERVGRLPEAQRATVMLAYVEGYSYAETAKILEIPIGTVMSRLAAARKSLKDSIGDVESRRA